MSWQLITHYSVAWPAHPWYTVLCSTSSRHGSLSSNVTIQMEQYKTRTPNNQEFASELMDTRSFIAWLNGIQYVDLEAQSTYNVCLNSYSNKACVPSMWKQLVDCYGDPDFVVFVGMNNSKAKTTSFLGDRCFVSFSAVNTCLETCLACLKHCLIFEAC